MKGQGGIVKSTYPVWPFVMSCGSCGLYGARCYPYPGFEDAGDFEDPEEVSGGSTVGTIWCQRCSPPWGEYLLQQMSIAALARAGIHAPPVMDVLGGLPVEAIGFLESELADFLDGPGPLNVLRPHWYGEGPIAPKSEAFWWACADLVAGMREARLIGFLSLEPLVATA